VGFALIAAVLAAYWGARETSVFAIDRVEVRGAPPTVARDVEKATRGLLGTSLLVVDAAGVEGKVRSLPTVAAASVDRSFPHTLVVRVAPVWPVGVARRGDRAWLVSAAGRPVRRIDPRGEAGLPRIWVPRKVGVEIGRPLPARYAPAIRVLSALRDVRLPGRVKSVRATGEDLVVVLRNGLEVVVGRPVDLLVKLAVAARVLPLVDEGAGYLDVSVPERPVAGVELNPQVEVESMALAMP
jgi:cell division protein FtsQ